MGFIIGIDPTKTRTSAEGREFKLGTIGWEGDAPALLETAMGVTGGSGGSDTACNAYLYVEVNNTGTFADGKVCLIDGSNKAYLMTDTLSAPGTGQGHRVGIARAALPNSGFGWVQIYGKGTISVLASCAAATQLTTSATGGSVDDATTAGLEVVDGLTINTANGGSTANVEGVITWPRVGRTL